MKFSLVALALLLSLSIPAYAGEDEAKAAEEAKEAELEEKAAENLPGEVSSPLRGINMKGVFQAQQPVDAKAAVIGWFKNEKQSYMVKPDNDEVRAKLLQFNGKTIMVFAKERNRGKYLIVMGIVEEPDGTTPKRKKKGF